MSGLASRHEHPNAIVRHVEVLRTWRTLRHLRSAQIAHRVFYRGRRLLWERRSASVDARYRARAAALPALRWDHPGLARVADYRLAARPEADALATARDALEGRFRFLGRSECFGPEVSWFRPDLDQGTRLWKTLLHEFGYATDLARAAAATGDARYRERWLALARDWRAHAPIGCRDFALDAWNARAVATRLVHLAVAGRVQGLAAGDPDADWLGREIGLHGLFLRDNLELDLGGNHLFRDAVGLVFAQELVGGVPDALDRLARVVARQVLPDGGHEERAPFYHAVCTQDLLEVALLLGPAAPGWLPATLGRMSGFLEAITLGDGEIPLLGDGWLGEVPTPAVLRTAQEVGAPVAPLAPEHHGGLVPLRAGAWRVVVRAGRHAPDEQMGHAHADLLSFDASHGAARVVTDTGTLLYDPGPERQRVRATAAHNTLRIDAQEQIEAWGSFRVGRRGQARVWARGHTGAWDWVSASHDAYRRLPGRPVHHRLVAAGERGLLVLDAVLGTGRHHMESHLHEHPSAGSTGGMRFVPLAGQVTREPAPLHERFGETRPMRRHRVDVESELPWVGGWWIAPPSRAPVGAALAFHGDEVEVRLADPPFELSWRPHSTAAREAVSFGSDAGGRANRGRMSALLVPGGPRQPGPDR